VKFIESTTTAAKAILGFLEPFQNAVLSILELQKEFGSGSDHIRASQKFVEIRKKMRNSQVTRGQFFEKLYENCTPKSKHRKTTLTIKKLLK